MEHTTKKSGQAIAANQNPLNKTDYEDLGEYIGKKATVKAGPFNGESGKIVRAKKDGWHTVFYIEIDLSVRGQKIESLPLPFDDDIIEISGVIS